MKTLDKIKELAINEINDSLPDMYSMGAADDVIEKYIDQAVKAEQERILEALPEEKKITKSRMGDYYEDEDYKGYNKALKEIKNIIKGKDND